MKLPANYNEMDMHERRAVRLEYVRLQDGRCHYCNAMLDGEPSATVRRMKINRKLFPARFFDWPVHLHHSHDTGMTIGAVHALCNAALWQYHGE